MNIDNNNHYNSALNNQLKINDSKIKLGHENINKVVNDTFEKKSDTKQTKANWILCGALALTSVLLGKGVNKLLNNPSQKTLAYFNEKTNEISKIENDFRKKVNDYSDSVNSKMKTFFAQKEVDENEIKSFDGVIKQITNSKTNNELLENEENAFKDLEDWFLKKFDQGKKTIEEYDAYSKKNQKEIEAVVKNSLEETIKKIDDVSNIDENILKQKRNKNLIEKFIKDTDIEKQYINGIAENINENFEYNSRLNFRHVNNYSHNVMNAYNEIEGRIFSAVSDKVYELTGNKLDYVSPNKFINGLNNALPQTTQDAGLIPQNIIDNELYKTISKITDENDLNREMPKIAQELNQKNSLSKLNQIAKRFNIRKCLTNDTSLKTWYECQANNVKLCSNKIDNKFDDMLLQYNKKNNIKNLTKNEKEQIIYSLQECAKKTGCSSTKEYIELTERFGSLNSAFSDDPLDSYRRTFLSDIYPQIKYLLDDTM